ncbi:MAG TPA: EAL domain-containing protein [Patescibacteria group bacterium]|nr:EAL domain-containing protein [Patescibacteria group bacterium]
MTKKTQQKNPVNFQALFEAAPDLFLVLKPDTPIFTIVAVSSAYARATMTKREEIIGKGLFKVFPDNPEDAEATGTQNLCASLERVIASGQSDTMAVQKYDIPLPGGGFEERHWSPLNTPVFIQNTLTYIIHRVEDVTEFMKLKAQGIQQSKLAEELRSKTGEMELEIYRRAQEIQRINQQLLAANEQLSRLDKLKTEFFSNISHEFRTPLSLILAPITELQASAADTELREELDLIARNARRLNRLVNNLLDFSRLEAGTNKAAYELVDLRELTQDLAAHFTSAMEKARLDYIIDCHSIAQPTYVDREMWEKIVFNLLSNAYKYTLTGSVKVTLVEDENEAVLSVADTGQGIAPEDLPHVFERFYRTHSNDARSFEGSGIGLALVSELAKLHGGRVAVVSTQGQGSSFSVRIPTGHAHLPHEQIRKRTNIPSRDLEEVTSWLTEETDQTDESPHINVLVVDDNADMRAYLRRVLKAAGYSVATAHDGRLALQKIERVEFDLIITDVMMPHVDGFSLLAQLRSNPRTRSMPVIMISARAGNEAAVEGIEKGADDYVIKPFTVRDLLARVKTHLRLTQLRYQEGGANSKTAEFVADLRRGIEQGEMLLYFQPIVTLATNQIVAVEALVRWQHPDGMRYPNDFIPLAEESGLIIPLGEWVIAEACRQQRRWRELGLNARVSVNVCARQLASDTFVQEVQKIIQKNDALEFEITESALMQNLDLIEARLRELKALGVTLSLDDFGQGYSSLNYVLRLPLDNLKIDRAFVHDCLAHETSANIVKAICYLGTSLKLGLIAEGVEQAEQVEFLKQAGCEFMQGYYILPPKPFDDFMAWVNKEKKTTLGT